MDDVGLLVLGWELPYLRPCWLKPGGPWDGEEPPWIGLAGGGGPGGPANLALWDHDQWLWGGCLWGWLASLSTLRQTYRGINTLMPLFTNDYARRISFKGMSRMNSFIRKLSERNVFKCVGNCLVEMSNSNTGLVCVHTRSPFILLLLTWNTI